MVNMRELYPTVEESDLLWAYFVENVDPLVKILHKPTTRKAMIEVYNHIDSPPKELEPLIFAIYFTAIISLQPEQTIALFGEDKTTLMRKYRFALEQALARANFVQSQDIHVLQAFTLFLVSWIFC